MPPKTMVMKNHFARSIVDRQFGGKYWFVTVRKQLLPLNSFAALSQIVILGPRRFAPSKVNNFFSSKQLPAHSFQNEFFEKMIK